LKVSSATSNGSFLALGDSIAFGEDPRLPRDNPDAFESFADEVASVEHLNLTNFGQPGETTASFLDVNARNNGGWMTDPKDPSRRIHDRPLHASYSVDQADAAVAFLKAHPDTKLVTLTLGGNDLLLLKRDSGSGLCGTIKLALGLPAVTLHIYENIKAGLAKIRSVYRGPIVVTDVYNTDYANRLQGLGIQVADFAIREAAREADEPSAPVRLADLYGSFETAVEEDPQSHGSSGAAGLLIPFDGGYDHHPSAEGRAVIAKTVEQAVP
jgi:lysophospholipase L1-like esterase